MMPNPTKNNWFPWALLHPDTFPEKYAVIVLNTPITWKPEFLLPFWEKATMRMLVDGGSNRWFEWLRDNRVTCDSNVAHPTLITGDMDSIDKKLLANFKQNEAKIIYTPNQNETDFTKSIKEMVNHASKHNIEISNVIAVVDTWGRMDQIMANIQTLFRCRDTVPQYNVFLLGSDSLSWLVSAGKHRIHVPEQLRNKWCSLIPIGGKCHKVTTTGLKWNLDNQSLCFGELVSTSNTYSGDDIVTIATSDTLLWSMGLDNIPTNRRNSSICI